MSRSSKATVSFYGSHGLSGENGILICLLDDALNNVLLFLVEGRGEGGVEFGLSGLEFYQNDGQPFILLSKFPMIVGK